MNTEQKLLEIQKLLSEVVGEFEIRTLRVLNIDKPFSRTLDDNARSIRELHRGLHTTAKYWRRQCLELQNLKTITNSEGKQELVGVWKFDK
jgi:hypothetical protein